MAHRLFPKIRYMKVDETLVNIGFYLKRRANPEPARRGTLLDPLNDDGGEGSGDPRGWPGALTRRERLQSSCGEGCPPAQH